MTMNWVQNISFGSPTFRSSAQARRVASRPCSHANKGANTYRNVWIVGQDIFVRRRGLSLRSGWRRFFGLQGRVLVDLVEELQDAMLLLQLDAGLILRRRRRQRRDRREIRRVIFGHFSRRRGLRLCLWSRFVDGVEGRAGRKWVEEGGGAVTKIGCEKLRTGQQWSALAAAAPRTIEHDRWICLYLAALSTYQQPSSLACKADMPVSGANCLVPLSLDSALDPPVSSLAPVPAPVTTTLPLLPPIATLIFNICRKLWPRMAKPYKPREGVCSP
jgi:hypothetical protein